MSATLKALQDLPIHEISSCRFRLRHIDAFIALSRFSAEKHAEFGFARPMTVMPSFLPDALVDEAPRILTGRPYFLFVGRLEHIKGLQDVIPAFDDSLPADLLIAGTGSYEATLRELAAKRPNVRFLGFEGPDRLRSLYRNATALITPSICYEVFPLVVLEAFQQGVPIIARRLGPYPEIVQTSNGGLLFSDRTELEVALRRLTVDVALRDAMGRSAQQAFKTHWSETIAVAAYFDLIHEIATQRGLTAVSTAFAAT